MNDRERIDQTGWYAPLHTPTVAPETAVTQTRAKPAAEKREAPPRRKKKRRGWTLGRALGVLALVVLVIIGTSLYFSDGDVYVPGSLPDAAYSPPAERPPKAAGEPDSPSSDGMPDDWVEFFRDFYESVEMEKQDIRIERVELPLDFKLPLKAKQGKELSLNELYQSCSPAVVGVSAYRDGESGYNWGSGLILSEDGLILTNTHLVNDTDHAVVTLVNNEEYDALLVGADITSDVAVLKIEASGLPVAVFGDSGQMQIGESVAAIGNPLGMEFRNTLTNGIISAIERGVSYNGRTMTLLQTNTAINEGNSGGALFNMYGQVVGVTNMKMMSSLSSIEGIGFAIPSATVQKVVDALVRDGEVRGRPAIGITVGAIPESAMERYDIPGGLYVSEVSKGSDAQKKGIREGDIILAADGVPVKTTEEIAALKNLHEVGDAMVLTVWRDGEEMEISVILGDNNDIYG